MITTHEGKYLNLADMRRRLHEPEVIDQALGMLKVGCERGDELRRVIQLMIGEFIHSCGGEKT
jgi:hypothetical protein